MAAFAPVSPPSVAHLVSRVVASLLGGWTFAWGFTTLGICLGMRAGMGYDQALALVYLFAFIVFLVAFCWSFAASSLARVWTVLAGGGALMTLVAWLLVPAP